MTDITTMDEGLKRDVATSCAARADFYRFLASVFLYELTDEQIETVAAARFPQDGTQIGAGYARIAEYMRHRDLGTRQELAVDYAHTFLGAGNYNNLTAPPYESVYTSEERLLMQDARDGALRYYRAEGLDLPSDNTTPEDHIGFEMQFMATLIERMAAALEEGNVERFDGLVATQRGFFNDHLANWLPAFADDIDTFCRTDFYHGVADLVRGLLAEERAVLDDLTDLAAESVEDR